MGLIEQIKSGSVFSRGTVTLSYPPGTGDTTEFGATYIILGISADNPCRVRLYANSSSVAIDAPRQSGSFDYSASVALSLDAVLTPGSQSITFNPPVIATTTTESRTWYNVESTLATNASLLYYPIESSTAITTRKYLNIPPATLNAYETSSGNIQSDKSFLMINAFSPSQSIRLRLYSRPIEDISSAEKSRPFISQSGDGSHLISDMLFDSASYEYPISPVLQAYNLESYTSASNRVGYILENTAGVTQTNLLAAIRVYPIEN